MGLEITREAFDDADYARFAQRLTESLAVLAEVLARPGFGDGPITIGAELELFLVDADGRPLPRNRAVLAQASHPLLTLEADRFNLECTTSPQILAGRPFSALGTELADLLARVRAAAANHGGRSVTIGILPTLQETDLQRESLTETARYRALSAGLRRLRREPFTVRIDGDDPLLLACDDVTMEGANTSWQVHLKVPLAHFAATYNAAQIAIAPVLATSANSPTFLGHRLWDETRIALFRQAVDDRAAAPGNEDWRPARVTFGHGWVRRGPQELFAEGVMLHAPVIPLLGPESPRTAAAAGLAPRLDELRLHSGTVWRWNRAVYDPSDGGHTRIEMRALPAGPTLPDMLANAAFLVGCTLALAEEEPLLLAGLTFGQARANFYSAARHGLEAEMLWPRTLSPSPTPRRARDVVQELLPGAEAALCKAGVDSAEVANLLGIIEARVRVGTTGASWQRRTLASLTRRMSSPDALRELLRRYMDLSATDAPVHTWPDEPA